jgi:ornithine decarboxylase
MLSFYSRRDAVAVAAGRRGAPRRRERRHAGPGRRPAALDGVGALIYPARVPVVDFATARQLARELGTPLLVLSEEKLRANVADLQGSLPGVRLNYAVKANPHPEVLKILLDERLGFDVSSPDEIRRVLDLGAAPEDLLYTKPVNKESELDFAHRAGVRWFVVDNGEEVAKLARLAPESNVLVRLKVSTRDAVVDLSYKFGARPAEALQLVQKINQEGLAVRGLSFHVGSQCTNPYSYVESILTCRTIFNHASSLGITMDTLDIGGGFPVSYLEPVMPVEQFAEPIAAALRQYFGSYRLVAEPGRFLVGDAVTLVAQVIGRSVRDEIKWYYIDDGLYGSLSGKLYDHCDYPITVEKEGRRELCVIAGPTCDSFDVVYSNRALPDLAIGDLLLFDGMGAYTNASATHFNGLPPARLVVV